jgi:membrane-associated PAP2 superfamily phosphatase
LTHALPSIESGLRHRLFTQKMINFSLASAPGQRPLRFAPGWSFWIGHALLPLLVWGLLACLFEITDWDLLLSDPFYDVMRGGWYLKNSWWAEHLIHQGGRDLIALLGAGALLLWGISFFRERLRPWRRAVLFLALCIALGTGLTALGKMVINRHCPWDYTRYGGKVPYVRLFESPAPDYPVGHGFPAGHAAGGYALLGSYFIFYRRSRRLAMAGLLLGLTTGTVFAVGQQVRGAHFASHNLWTILICWGSALLLYTFIFRGRILAPPARSGATLFASGDHHQSATSPEGEEP